MNHDQIMNLLDAHTAQACKGKDEDYLIYFRKAYYGHWLALTLESAIANGNQESINYVEMLKSNLEEKNDVPSTQA